MRIQVLWEDSTKGRNTWPIFQSGRSRSAVGAHAGVITCSRLLIANCARIWCFRHVRVPRVALSGCCLDLEPRPWQDPRTDRTRAASSVASGGCAVFGSDSPGLEHQLSSAARRLSRHTQIDETSPDQICGRGIKFLSVNLNRTLDQRDFNAEFFERRNC
jgi:hypothetical protein